MFFMESIEAPRGGAGILRRGFLGRDGVGEVLVGVAVDLVAEQSRVDPAKDFAPPPPGYALLAAGIDAEIGVRRPIQVGLEGTNLLNTAYREYNSLLRYYADHPGRDLRVRVGMTF